MGRLKTKRIYSTVPVVLADKITSAAALLSISESALIAMLITKQIRLEEEKLNE